MAQLERFNRMVPQPCFPDFDVLRDPLACRITDEVLSPPVANDTFEQEQAKLLGRQQGETRSIFLL